MGELHSFSCVMTSIKIVTLIINEIILLHSSLKDTKQSLVGLPVIETGGLERTENS